MMQILKSSVVVLASIAGIAMAQIGMASAQTEGSAIRIGWQPDPNAAFYMARDKHLFEKAGLKPEYIKFTAGPPMFAALQSDSVDVVEIGLAPAIIGKSQGIDIKIFLVSVDVSDTNVLVVQGDESIKSPSDLKGKRVAALRGATPYFGLTQYLNKAGLDLKDIQFVDLSAQNTVPAFRRKEVDAAWVWSPWQNMLIGMGGKRLSSNMEVGALSPQVWVVRSEWAQKNPETLQKFLKAIDGGFHAVSQDGSIAAKQLAESLNIDPDVATQVLKANGYPDLATQLRTEYLLSLTASVGEQGLKSATKKATDFLLSQGIISKPAEAADLIDVTPVQQYLKTQ